VLAAAIAAAIAAALCRWKKRPVTPSTTVSSAPPAANAITGRPADIASSGVMPKLHLLPCTITVIDQDNYSIGIDTTTFGSFSGTAQASQFITLNVGGRGAYPVTFPIPATPAF